VTKPRRGIDDLLAAQDRIAPGEGRAEREERHEGDPALLALLEHGHGGPIGQVQRILHAGDLRMGERVEQVAEGDVAKADAADHPVIAG
jgi:hypothetical protein